MSGAVDSKSQSSEAKPGTGNVPLDGPHQDDALARVSSGGGLEKTSNTPSLFVPFSVPVRPISPDTVSNLSAEEYQQLQPSISNETNLSTETPLSPGWRTKVDQFWIRNKGIAFMLVAQVFGVLMNVTTRLLEIEGNKGQGMHPFQILFARMGITLTLASAYMWYNKTPYFPFGMPEVRWLLIARGLAGFAGVFGMYYSLLYLPLADATVITFLAPSLACFACSILINEPFTRVEQVCALVSLVGVVLIARPSSLFTGWISSGNAQDASGQSRNSTTALDAGNFDDVTSSERLSGVGVALIGVLGSAAAYTVIRWIGKRAHPLISVNYFAVWVFVVSIVAQSTLPNVGWLLPADLKEWAYLLFLGACGFIMQFLLATALAYEKSSRVTNMVYTSMLFALFFDKLIFDHTPGAMSILGSSLILGSAIVVAIQQDPNKNKKQSARGTGRGDEESRTGLTHGNGDIGPREHPDRLQVQEVQLRTLR